MCYSIRLPLSETAVILSVFEKIKFNSENIPPIFKSFDTGQADALSRKYFIILTIADNHLSNEGSLIYNFRDLLFIYEKDMQISVEIAETSIDDPQNLANMGISIALCQILSREGFFMLHAASVVRNDQGFVFPGFSGSGKTTISRLSAVENHVLCDELTAVTARLSNPDGIPGNTYRIFSGPRWADFTFKPEYYCDATWREKSHSAYPLRAVIFPSKSELRDETWLEKVKSIDAAVSLMARFFETAFVKALPAETLTRTFHFFSRLARRVPCYTIHANIKTDIWKAIDETIGK